MASKADKATQPEADETPEPTKPIARPASAEATIEELRAQVAQLTELVTRPRANGPMISPAELARHLSNDPQVRPESDGAINPHSGKPYFNPLRATGKH